MACAICQVRKPRRYCPAVHGDICTVCCAEGREVTVSCPLDCSYLRDARRHEKPPAVDFQQAPHRDLAITRDFLLAHEAELYLVTQSFVSAALATQGAIDDDARDALESLIRTHQSLASGVFYETRSENRIARAIQDDFQSRLDAVRRREQERVGSSAIRESTVLSLLVFLRQLEFTHNNRKPRGRAFLDYLLHAVLPPSGGAALDSSADAASLILP